MINKNNNNKNIKKIQKNTKKNIKTSIKLEIKEEKDLICLMINKKKFCMPNIIKVNLIQFNIVFQIKLQVVVA